MTIWFCQKRTQMTKAGEQVGKWAGELANFPFSRSLTLPSAEKKLRPSGFNREFNCLIE